METLLVLLGPIVIVVITGLAKSVKFRVAALAGRRKLVIRTIAAVLSLVAVVFVPAVTGAVADPAIVDGAVQTILLFLGSLGLYSVVKKK